MSCHCLATQNILQIENFPMKKSPVFGFLWGKKSDFCNPEPPSCLATSEQGSRCPFRYGTGTSCMAGTAGSLQFPQVPTAPEYLLRLLGCFGLPLASVGIWVCKRSSLPMTNYRWSLCLPRAENVSKTPPAQAECSS